MSKNSLIDSIEVKNPCSEEWDEMTGNDKVRFCSHCAKSVNNLSEMTRKQAVRLVRRSGGNLCIRYVKDKRTNTPLFAATLHQIARRTGAAAGVLGASLMLSAAGYAQGEAVATQTVQAEQQLNTGGAVSKLSGYVTDPNGAVIPYAIVSVTSDATLESHIMNASAEGFYEFTGLAQGSYKLKIEAGGFDAQEIADVYVGDGSESRRDAQMAIQQVDVVVQVGGSEGIIMETMGGAMFSIPETGDSLIQAVLSEDIDQVKALIASRSSINVKDKAYDGITPLHAAVETGNFEIVQYLLAYGAKPNIRDSQKRTPLMMLDEDAKPEIIQALIAYGAKFTLLDKQKNTVLHHYAADDGEPELIRMLVSHGASVNAKNKQGKTALMAAAENGNPENVKALLEGGADVNLLDNKKKSAWDLAAGGDVRMLLETFGSVAGKR